MARVCASEGEGRFEEKDACMRQNKKDAFSPNNKIWKFNFLFVEFPLPAPKGHLFCLTGSRVECTVDQLWSCVLSGQFAFCTVLKTGFLWSALIY